MDMTPIHQSVISFSQSDGETIQSTSIHTSHHDMLPVTVHWRTLKTKHLLLFPPDRRFPSRPCTRKRASPGPAGLTTAFARLVLVKEPRNHAPARELNTEFFVHDAALVKSIAAGLGLLPLVDAQVRGQEPLGLESARFHSLSSSKSQAESTARPDPVCDCAPTEPRRLPRLAGAGLLPRFSQAIGVCACVYVCVRGVRSA